MAKMYSYIYIYTVWLHDQFALFFFSFTSLDESVRTDEEIRYDNSSILLLRNSERKRMVIDQT